MVAQVGNRICGRDIDSVRREVPDELKPEIVPPKLNQGDRRNWKYSL